MILESYKWTKDPDEFKIELIIRNPSLGENAFVLIKTTTTKLSKTFKNGHYGQLKGTKK